MLRNLGIAAMLGLALVMPVHEAAAQDVLGGAIIGGGAGALFGARSADVAVRPSVRSSGRGRGLPSPLRVNGAGTAIIITATAVTSNARTGRGFWRTRAIATSLEDLVALDSRTAIERAPS